MKGKILRKVLATVLVLTFVSGAVPIQPVSDMFGRTVITANAEDGVTRAGIWGQLQEAINANTTVKIQLAKDITSKRDSDSTLNIPYGKTVTIDLNGFTLTQDYLKGRVINVGGTLILEDSSADKTGCITGGHKLSGEYSDHYGWGGCVYIGNYGEFTMNGGTISGNVAYTGGGVFIDGGTFTMNDGTISGNTATNGFGGVSDGGSGTFIMNGGTITGNTALNDGGGVGANGTFIMNGGTISGNIAQHGTCSDVHHASSEFKVSGSPVIDDICIDTSNPEIVDRFFITVTGALSSSARLKLDKDSLANSHFVAKADTGYTLTETDAAAFCSTDETLIGTLNGNNQVIMSDAPLPASAHFSPDDDNTYTIHDEEGWEIFCNCLNDNPTYNRFSGKTVKLGADITVSRMAGYSQHDFCGTFDGDGYTLTFNYGTSQNYAAEEYIAPFRYVSNTKANSSDAANSPVTIKNLHVNGDIYTSKQYAAGLMAQNWGTVNIINCRSSINIHSNVDISENKDGFHGGFIGAARGNVTIRGCVFDGKLLTTNGTIKCGGFIGWRSGGAAVYDSIFAPAEPSDGEVCVGTSGSATFACNTVDTYNCYYTCLLNDGTNYTPHSANDSTNPNKWYNGKAAHTITAGDNVTIDYGTPVENGTYSVSGITSYGTGLAYNGNFYAGEGDKVALTLSHAAPPAGYLFDKYTANGETLTGSTLTMPDDDVTVSAEIKGDISLALITLSDDSFEYDGNEKTITYTVTLGDKTLTEGTDFIFEGDLTAADTGVYIVKVKGINTYGSEAKTTWKIVPAAVTVTINGTPVKQNVEYNKSLTVKAPKAPTGKKFSHWTVNGKTVSYSAKYSFIVEESVDLIPVYVADETVVEQQAILNLKTSQTTYNGKNAIKYTFTHSIPQGYTVREAGLLYATNKLAGADTTKSGYAAVNLVNDKTFGVADVESAVKNNTSGKVKKYVASYQNLNGTISFSYAVGANTTAYTYAVGYVKVEKDGVEQTLYTNFVATNYSSANS